MSINTVYLRFEHSPGAAHAYTVQLCQGRVAIGPLPLAPAPAFAPLIAEVRRRYERQLRLLYELAATGMPAPPASEHDVHCLGQAVAALLPASVCRAIIAAVHTARKHGKRTRFVVQVAAQASALLGIPWELLVLPVGWGSTTHAEVEPFLFLNADVSMVREVIGSGRQVPEAAPLRSLASFAAAPAATNPINVVAVATALAGPAQLSPGDVYYYAGADTMAALIARMTAARPQIVHLVCHGERSDNGRVLARYDLVLTSPTGMPLRVGARDLARVLALSDRLQIVILQVCDSGTISLHPPTPQGQMSVESAALTLIRAGVPLVIAMQAEVSQAAALAFLQTCAASLVQHGDYDRAVSHGRIAMRAAGGIVDWSLPVVYRGSA